MIVSFPASKRIGMKSKRRTVEAILEQVRKIPFSLVLAVLNIRNMKREKQDCSKFYVSSVKRFVVTTFSSQKNEFSSKGLNKRTLEDSGDSSLAKYRQIPDEVVNLESTNRGFKMTNHAVATNEQIKKD